MATVLFVDDSHRDRTLAKVLLGRAGHQVFEAENCDDGLEATRAHMPDCIVVCLHTPFSPGTDVVSAFRLLAKDTHLIAVGFGLRDETRSECLEAGADICLSRPFDVEKLIDIVAKALDGDMNAACATGASLSCARAA